MNDRLYFSVGEAAKILGCHPVTVRRQIALGAIPAIRVGRPWRIPMAALEPETALRRRESASETAGVSR